LDEITRELERTTSEMQLPYTLKAGVGYVIVSPEESLNLSDCLRRADEAMYQMKEKQHKDLNY
jgi:GGDEF domain-containing protein